MQDKHEDECSNISERESVYTVLSPEDRLPLTCTRAGTCCHGKEIWLNPWEIACLAQAHDLPSHEFRGKYTVDGGVRLRMDSAPGWKNLLACSQYDAGSGCVVHAGRPLACRLFPLGRVRQRDEISYVHEGEVFPCMEGCPEVEELPLLSVEEYLKGQQTLPGETAQDGYIELMQILADDALHLLLDTELAESDLRDEALQHWREVGDLSHEARADLMGEAWLDALTTPALNASLTNTAAFVQEHEEYLEARIEKDGSTISTLSDLESLCSLVMALSLHLGTALGLPSAQMVEHWIETAKSHLPPQ
ncbi:MAG: YkgJ family cysteine cluster protein [Planctomycetes bacterium]|nr:YkgJ family cysteine cluster protein [Planctomycetota bacterium]